MNLVLSYYFRIGFPFLWLSKFIRSLGFVFVFWYIEILFCSSVHLCNYAELPPPSIFLELQRKVIGNLEIKPKMASQLLGLSLRVIWLSGAVIRKCYIQLAASAPTSQTIRNASSQPLVWTSKIRNSMDSAQPSVWVTPEDHSDAWVLFLWQEQFFPIENIWKRLETFLFVTT